MEPVVRQLLPTSLLTIILCVILEAASIDSQTRTAKLKSEPANRLNQNTSGRPTPETLGASSSQLVKQKAESELLLLREGKPNSVWRWLRHSHDPTRRTYLIHGFARMGVDPQLIIRRLEVEDDASARRALILSLGMFDGERLSENLRRLLILKLLRWYRDDPDAGTHSAIDWLLRYGTKGEAPRKLDWHQQEQLHAIDKELKGQTIGGRNWYSTYEGHTMVILRGPLNLLMGSPQNEPGRAANETQHRVRILRTVAIANKEVTVAQFQRFLEANPKLEHAYPDSTKDPRRGSRVMQLSPDDDCPQIAMTWFEAAQYCNWLSKQEGLPESEWCYPTDLNQIKGGMELPKDYLQRTGYRLLTEAEWEYACRAGALTSRFYGDAEELLTEYAWYSKNPPKRKSDPTDPNDPQRTWPVGQLMPNDFGLFDMYGNVWEWAQDRWQEYPSTFTIRDDVEDSLLKVMDAQARTRRGGSFSYESAVMRSAHRGAPNAYFPMQRRDNVGFRVARTYR